ILRGIVVPMQTRATVWAGMPADGQAFLDQHTTARARLARVGRRHSYDSPTGPCCLVGEDAHEATPPGIADALGEVMVLDHVGRLPGPRDKSCRWHEGPRVHLCGGSLVAASPPSEGLSPTVCPPCAGGGPPSCAGSPAVGPS